MAFVPLEKLGRLHDGYKKVFKVDRHNLLLMQLEGKVYLIENRCPHMDVPLDTGTALPGGRLRCRAHGIEFNLESGRADGPLAKQLECLKRYAIRYEGSQLGVEL
ncbi:Rieske (2Fe-2S) protein [Teredinibacter franksiae]|uniref:Rieske (2Fe-2S) protein n=1 Tax=Teredinibacter franksiae TaxID=2761453 RepID=UPI0016231988|nr:Rieske 2Fe-2S domain-containing protein [Teredinibacter franksiae]